MWRYPRLFAHFVQFSVSRSMEFRFDFFFRIVMDLLFYAVQISFYMILFNATDSIGGWNQSQALIFVAAYCVVDAVQMTLFSNNMWFLPVAVNKGDLDYHLIRPVSSLFMLSLRDFAVNSFVNLIFAVGLLVWALGRYPGPIDPVWLICFLLLVPFGAFFHYCLHLLFVLPVFWTQASRGFEQVFWSLTRFSERPHQVFRGWTRRILLSLLPFGLMASMPAHVLFGEVGWMGVVHIVSVAAALFAFVCFLWSRALRVYGSASS